jgi:3-hydroxyacyl-CoA dehydrogenase
MKLDEALTSVAVLGAVGKMGSGIAALLLQEMAKRQAETQTKHVLTLIDVNEMGFTALGHYLREQLLKYAEKNIISLRQSYIPNPKLVSNEEIIKEFVNLSMDSVRFSSHVEAARHAKLVFEAILEDVNIKTKIFKQIIQAGNKEGYFLSNTSSIPIGELAEQAGLGNRLIGYHFYNPPLIQKLLEIIPASKTSDALISMARELAKCLKKTIVDSKDIAGFIGNGYMIREIVFACDYVKKLSDRFSKMQSIYILNRITQEWLVRPMGIFQLMDYVGLDVCHHIAEIMSYYLRDESIQSALLDEMLSKGVLGGQNPDGTQKNGFFSYNKNRIEGIYTFENKEYKSIDSWIDRQKADQYLGSLPQSYISWKDLQKKNDKTVLLESYFKQLFQGSSQGDHLAKEFLENLKSITSSLVSRGVAKNSQDVDQVLLNGFYHIYGTIVI